MGKVVGIANNKELLGKDRIFVTEDKHLLVETVYNEMNSIYTDENLKSKFTADNSLELAVRRESLSVQFSQRSMFMIHETLERFVLSLQTCYSNCIGVDYVTLRNEILNFYPCIYDIHMYFIEEKNMSGKILLDHALAISSITFNHIYFKNQELFKNNPDLFTIYNGSLPLLLEDLRLCLIKLYNEAMKIYFPFGEVDNE